MKKKLNFYRKTSVNWAKSQAQIGKLLDQVGVKDVRFTLLNSEKSVICEFNYPSEMEGKAVNLGVRMIIKIPPLKDEEQSKNQVHRALFNVLKSKFVSMEFGVEEFVQVFMAHLVVFDKNGNSSTLHQMIAPQYTKGILSGEQKNISMIEHKDESTA